jgi:Olfactomedin-like domain
MMSLPFGIVRREAHEKCSLSVAFIADCVLYAVGKPVFFKSAEQNYGAWLRDPTARNDIVAERIWMTKENDGFQLFEYANKVAYRQNLPSKVYRMQFPFKVSGGTVKS